MVSLKKIVLYFAATESLKSGSLSGVMPFPSYMYPMTTSDPRLVDLSNRTAAVAAATAASRDPEVKSVSPSGGLKRSLREPVSPSRAGSHDVLDLSIKKPKVESPVAARPSAVIPSHPSPLVPSGLVPMGLPGHVGIPVTSSSGLSVPIPGLQAPSLQSLAASGYSASAMLDPRALALSSYVSAAGSGSSSTLSLAHAQQQALSLGYPVAYMPSGLAAGYSQLCATSSTDRDKLLKAQQLQFAADIRM